MSAIDARPTLLPALAALDELTAREYEVLRLIASGYSNQGIASELWLTMSTVETHVRRIFCKLGLLPGDGQHRRVLAALTFREGDARDFHQRIRALPAAA